jgi:hypothetical protein
MCLQVKQIPADVFFFRTWANFLAAHGTDHPQIITRSGHILFSHLGEFSCRATPSSSAIWSANV